MTSMTPVSAAEGLRSRDPGLLEELVRQHHTRVLHYLLAVTRSRDAAADLSQETWLRVIERGAQYRGDRPFESWLLTIARNLAIDRARRAAQWHSTPVQLDRQPSQLPSPHELALRAEIACRLQGAARHLSPPLRAVWRLRVDDGLSLAATAARLRVMPGTVRSRLHRSVSALRRARLTEPVLSVHPGKRTQKRPEGNKKVTSAP